MTRWWNQDKISRDPAKEMLRLRQMAHLPMTICIVTWLSMEGDDIPVRKQQEDDDSEYAEDELEV
jgi:hypothetical protein